LAAGGTVEQARAAILGSAEYFLNRAGGTNDSFLASIYQDVLGRSVDPSGQANWSAQLAAGIPRTAVAMAIVSSAEAGQGLVQGYYRQFLHRDADSTGLNSFVAALQHGVRDEQIIAILVGSDEYFSRL
jgi:hypothetical protein